MADPGELMAQLEAHATEMDGLSNSLAAVCRELEPAEREYADFIDRFEVGLYLKCEADGKRLPSEALRLKLARRDMRPELLGRCDGLRLSRDRMRQRISDLKTVIETKRSILSALKEGLI